jgi:hypothetical protein
MRFHTAGRLPAIFVTALLAGAAAISLSGTASAGNGLHDRVYADTFGNLIVQSPYGYKRIIVGEGRLAKELQNYTRGGEPQGSYDEPLYERQGYYDSEAEEPYVEPRYERRGYYDGEPGQSYAERRYERQRYYVDNCYRPPVLLKGRSHMYGLPDGVIPEPSGRCPLD